jgi:predicted 3-demethylubiquinone-9 3-methyltransferase (glyoxalase superfamily)
MKNFSACLWFDSQAEEAAHYYCSVFNGKFIGLTYYDEEASNAAKMPPGSVMTATFEVGGLTIMGLNGGPIFKFSEAVSLMVPCDSQAELDNFWAKLTADGGEESYCGWCKDKYGFSWQLVPAQLEKWMHDPDLARRARVMKAVLGMRKLDIAEMERAYEGTA